MRRAAFLLLPMLVTAGCAGSSSSQSTFVQPKPAAFKDGPCRAVADSVLSIGRDARKLGKGSTPPRGVRDDLKSAQDAVAAVQSGLDPALVVPFSRLVIAVGVVRLRADSNTFDPSLATSLSTAYDGVVSACTA